MKRRGSIGLKIMFPVFILGCIAIASNVMALRNIGLVNTNATTITDDYMESIAELSQIQETTQNIHKMALSHIIATDFNTMIELVDSIKEQEAQLDGYLAEFADKVDADTESDYQQLLSNYDNFKHSIVFLLGNSANSQKEAAYGYANGDVATYGNGMVANIDNMNVVTQTAAANAREELAQVYRESRIGNNVSMAISVVLIIYAVLSVLFSVVRPLTVTKKELSAILDNIENRQGDLTQRVSIHTNDEIAALGDGINAFMEKLQSILLVITDNSNKMDVVVTEVLESVRTSNDSVSDLSALTEELSATMQEVSNNASTINQNTADVHTEVNVIAQEASNMTDYARVMKQNADKMEASARSNMEETDRKVTEILDILNRAIEESKSVDQVNSLTNAILGISSQTNLLALNASIEAARAGEAGKGFAVVAEEIRQLADSSRDTANHIQEINHIVNNAVHNLSEQAGNLVTYMNDAILPEFQNFVDSGQQYKSDADHIQETMDNFNEKTDQLRNVVAEIATSIDGISTAIAEGVNGVTGAANSTQGLVEDMENITNRMDVNKTIAEDLQKETAIFTKL